MYGTCTQSMHAIKSWNLSSYPHFRRKEVKVKKKYRKQSEENQEPPQKKKEKKKKKKKRSSKKHKNKHRRHRGKICLLFSAALSSKAILIWLIIKHVCNWKGYNEFSPVQCYWKWVMFSWRVNTVQWLHYQSSPLSSDQTSSSSSSEESHQSDKGSFDNPFGTLFTF